MRQLQKLEFHAELQQLNQKKNSRQKNPRQTNDRA